MPGPVLQGPKLPHGGVQRLHGEDERRARRFAARLLGADGGAQDGRPWSWGPRLSSPLRPHEPRCLSGPWTRRPVHLQLDERPRLLRQAVHLRRGALSPPEDPHQPLRLRLRTTRRRRRCRLPGGGLCKLARGSLRGLVDGSRGRGWPGPSQLVGRSRRCGTLLSLPKTRRATASILGGSCWRVPSLSGRSPSLLRLVGRLPRLPLRPLWGSTLRPSENRGSVEGDLLV